MKPSITCTDPSSDAPNCSCTCTNGITFDQPLLPALEDGPNIALENCQTDKDTLLAREQEVTAELAAFKSKEYTYQGCYHGGVASARSFYVKDPSLSAARCQTICYPSLHFGVCVDACYCMDKLVDSTTRLMAKKECSVKKCPGNANEDCGNPGRIIVYSKTL